jgi:hypothetical protein
MPGLNGNRFAGTAVFGGIAQQVVDDLQQESFMSENRRQGRRNIDFEPVGRLASLSILKVRSQHALEREWLDRGPHSGATICQQEHADDRPLQPTGLIADLK